LRGWWDDGGDCCRGHCCQWDCCVVYCSRRGSRNRCTTGASCGPWAFCGGSSRDFGSSAGSEVGLDALLLDSLNEMYRDENGLCSRDWDAELTTLLAQRSNFESRVIRRRRRRLGRRSSNGLGSSRSLWFCRFARSHSEECKAD
jgi:hypothetical protein